MEDPSTSSTTCVTVDTMSPSRIDIRQRPRVTQLSKVSWRSLRPHTGPVDLAASAAQPNVFSRHHIVLSGLARGTYTLANQNDPCDAAARPDALCFSMRCANRWVDNPRGSRYSLLKLALGVHQECTAQLLPMQCDT
jgi:hypothetical protein